jgi:hypothetical protein
MPVDFLTPEQEAVYGCFSDTPTSEQLARYFWLDDKDKEFVWNRRGDHNQLGFAIQLGTVRFLGTFLSTPTDVPQAVITYMAEQLGLDGCTKLCILPKSSESVGPHERGTFYLWV